MPRREERPRHHDDYTSDSSSDYTSSDESIPPSPIRQPSRAHRSSRDYGGPSRHHSVRRESQDVERGLHRPRRESRDRRRIHKHRAGGAAAAAAASGGRESTREGSDEKLTSRRRSSKKKKRKGIAPIWKWCIGVTALVVIIVVIVVAVVVTKNKNKDNSQASGGGTRSSNGNGNRWPAKVQVPTEYLGTQMDPNTWLDKTDFNHTFTDEMHGDLPVIGLFSKWDDSARANPNVPPLNEKFPYGSRPIRGVNLGGWLVIEPFITPSFFGGDVIDEWTFSAKHGDKARGMLEEHYRSFVTEETFKDIRAAGLDHVRLPFGYWAVETQPGDAFVERTSWRYLLRAIEWARKYGLRVKLDIHGVPGGANGWNHSGRLGVMNWLTGPNGTYFGDETLKIHDRLSKFFAQPRYKNVVTMYGLVNEPKMMDLDSQTVIKWSEKAYDIVKKNGIEAYVIFGDGFRGLDKWKGEFPGKKDMLLDVHNYVIFDFGLIQKSATEKVRYACEAWSAQLKAAMDTSTGFGKLFVGEWGQADTDCTKYVNNVNMGSRWEGDLVPDQGPACPALDSSCSCGYANAHPNKYSAQYRDFLYKFAVAQMDAFENSWGWMYWTWDTEDAYQWSYKKGMQYGMIPKDVYDRKWSCEDEIPDWSQTLISQ